MGIALSPKPTDPGDHVYRSYKRVHRSEHARDEEEGKIRRETARHLRADRRGEDLARRMTQITDTEEVMDLYQARLEVGRKEKGNARTHKRRLKKLSRREDF